MIMSLSLGSLVNSKAAHLDLDLKLFANHLFILIDAEWTITFVIPQIRATMVYFQVSSAGPPINFSTHLGTTLLPKSRIKWLDSLQLLKALVHS